MDLKSVGARYDEIESELQEMALELERHLYGLVARTGVKGANVSSRVKQKDSFLKKALQKSVEGGPWKDPIVDCTDKVGGRVDVVYRADVLKLAEEIKSDGKLSVQKVDDKALGLGADSLGYGGVHIDAFLAGHEDEFAICEIQLRTHAQAAWAMASHELSYKGPVEPTDEQKRGLNRLTALVELFDEEVDRISEEIMNSPGFPLSTLIRTLESLWLTKVGKPYREDLTAAVVTSLLGGMSEDEAHSLSEQISAFADEHSEELLEAIQGLDHDPLMTQPELLLIYYELCEDKYAFLDLWIEKGFDPRLLDEVAVQLSIKLPQPS